MDICWLPEIIGSVLEVPIVRIIVLWGLYWDLRFLETTMSDIVGLPFNSAQKSNLPLQISNTLAPLMLNSCLLYSEDKSTIRGRVC